MPEERVYGVDPGQRVVGFLIRSFLVFADLHEQFHLGELRQHLTERLRGFLVLLRNDGVHNAADAGLYVDGGIVVRRRQLAGQDDVPVEDGAGFVRNGLRHVVALHQYGIQRRDGALIRIARPFHQLGKRRKHGRRETAPGRGFARGKADRDAAVKRRKEEMSSKEETQTAEKAVDQTAERADAAPADVKEVGLSIHDERGNMAEEAKTVAVKSTQDLISFSLGAPRDGADVEVDAPESMEIKSTKQVAKAVPVETPSDEAEPLIPPSDAMGSMDADEAAARVDEGVHLREVDVSGFHDAEVRADVEAPDVTSDSLGTGLEVILARRSA